MKTLLKAVPEIEPHILWKEVIGPQAIESWIGKPGGPCISTVQVPGQVAEDRPDIRSPIPGLYFAGDGAGARGIGTELAAQSAIECAEILDDDFRSGLGSNRFWQWGCGGNRGCARCRPSPAPRTRRVVFRACTRSRA